MSGLGRDTAPPSAGHPGQHKLGPRAPAPCPREEPDAGHASLGGEHDLRAMGASRTGSSTLPPSFPSAVSADRKRLSNRISVATSRALSSTAKARSRAAVERRQPFRHAPLRASSRERSARALRVRRTRDARRSSASGRRRSNPAASIFAAISVAVLCASRASLARGFFGDGQAPWPLVCLGVAVGLLMRCYASARG